MSASQPQANVLLQVVINLLIPTFLQAAGNDRAQARAAAIQALRESGATTGLELMAAAQAIAFSTAAITTLGDAMQPDQPPEAAQRQQALAVRLGHTANRCRRTLSRKQPVAAPSRPKPPTMDIPREMPRTDPSTSALWAAALADVAHELLHPPTSHPGSSAHPRPPAAPN